MSYLKLSDYLFETEEYFHYHGSGTGRLNKEYARKLFGIYTDKDSYEPSNYFYYEPKGLNRQAAEKTNEPNNLGTLLPQSSVSFHKHNSFLVLDIQKHEIILTPNSTEMPLLDPRTALQLSSLLDVFPEFSNYKVKAYSYIPEEGEQYNEIGTLQSVLANKKEISGKFPEYSRSSEESNDEEKYKEYRLEILQDLTELNWYHATRKSNWNSIKRFGLLPSKEFANPQQHGWTYLNMDLQNAVYLTHRKLYAQRIADTLAERYNEAAIVLEIKGQALKDKSKIVVDEDSLRNSLDGMVTPGLNIPGIPQYFTSLVKGISSIGYAGTIEPRYISVIEKIEPEIENNSEQEI